MIEQEKIEKVKLILRKARWIEPPIPMDETVQEICRLFDQSHLDWAKENGYVQLAEDQSLPKFFFSFSGGDPPNMRLDYQAVQQDMFELGWRRVIL